MYPIYEDVLQQARLLSLEDQARLLEELSVTLRHYIEGQSSHSITELRGLGREFWRGIDVDKYIEEERNSWHG